MRQPLFFASFHSGRSLAHTLWSLFNLALALVCSCLLFCAPLVHGSTTHACAPDTPPPVSGPFDPAATVQINEILTRPITKWNCTGSSHVWIELYNLQSQPIDLYAQHALLSLNGGQAPDTTYLLPFGTAIAAKGFLVLFPLEHLANPPSSIGSVALIMNNNPIDQVSVPLLQADQSYARVPDGNGNWQVVEQPTIDASNDTPGQTATAAATPTPTSTPKPNKTPQGGGTSGNTPAGTGTQPAWNQVKLPPGVTPTATMATLSDASTPPPSSQPQNPPAAQNGGSNNWQVVLIITFLLILLGVLTWCWRLFRAP